MKTIILLQALCVYTCRSKMEDMQMDIDDILRPDLMPSFLMMIEGPPRGNTWFNTTVSARKKEKLSSNGSWHEAFATMGFHRKMLNEYLCRNFVADNILNQIQRPLISKRMGKPPTYHPDKDSYPSASKRKSRAELSDVKENLLSDPGSSNYRDWLTKTTTLEDIYKHYDKDDPTSRNGHDSDEEYEGGEITGYAMPIPSDMRDYPHPPMDYQSHPHPMQQDDEPPVDSEKQAGHYDYTPHHIHIHGTADTEKGSQHGLAIPDVFDAALTALAFLSFGIFILQVIMCISMNKVPPLMQMVDGGGDAGGVDEIRFRRDISEQKSSINELARRVLKSIEAGVAAKKDEGECLRRVLCENNKFSRGLDYKLKILVPIWGLGMSWLSGRLSVEDNSPAKILESLKACALGLANADCSSYYSSCDLQAFLNRSEDVDKLHRIKRSFRRN